MLHPTITGHTVDPDVTVREQNAAKRERAARMLAEGRLTDAALLQRRCARLAKRATLVHYQQQLADA